jgi:hypothetical protein
MPPGSQQIARGCGPQAGHSPVEAAASECDPHLLRAHGFGHGAGLHWVTCYAVGDLLGGQRTTYLVGTSWNFLSRSEIRTSTPTRKNSFPWALDPPPNALPEWLRIRPRRSVTCVPFSLNGPCSSPNPCLQNGIAASATVLLAPRASAGCDRCNNRAHTAIPAPLTPCVASTRDM